MSSFVFIEFDRRPPVIGIYLPSSTTVKSVIDIVIESDESLSDFQEIYIVDSDEVRHDYTFHKDSNNLLIGIVNFLDFPIGLATVYAKVKDEVGNVSNLVSKSIMVRDYTSIFRLEVKHSCRGLEVNRSISEISDKNSSCKIDLKEIIKEVR